MTPLVLTSPRLVLRRLRAGDEAALVAYRGLPAVARYQSWESFDLADATLLVERQAGIVPDTAGTWIQLALVLSATEEIVGDMGIFFRSDEPSQVEIGITLAPLRQRTGIAREALAAVLAYVFGPLAKHRAIAVTDAENGPAARLFEGAGFRREAHHVDAVWFKGKWGSEYVFAMLRREWQSRTNEPSSP